MQPEIHVIGKSDVFNNIQFEELFKRTRKKMYLLIADCPSLGKIGLTQTFTIQKQLRLKIGNYQAIKLQHNATQKQ